MKEKKGKRLIKFLTDPDYRFESLGTRGYLKNMPDDIYLGHMFKAKVGYPLNFTSPQTFNEKLQWLKLHDRKPIYTTMVDKYAVKDYVASVIGEQYIIPTLGVWDNFDDIDFDALPDQFVLKCTHDSGGLVICKDKSKLDIKKAKKKINKSLHRNYYYMFREWPYKNVKPRIIAEKYIEDHSTSELCDYKFFCFNGTAKCYKVDFDRFISHTANYFTIDGELMKLGEEVCPPNFEKEIPTPENLDKMKEFAEKLSTTLPFLRADFYDVDGKLYFGEMTFYPASGFEKFIFDGNNELLDPWIKLPKTIGGYCLIYKDIFCVLDTSANTCISNTQGKLITDVYSREVVPLRDYKIYTFNGKANLCMINQDRGIHTRADYFDRDYNWLDFTWGYDHADVLPDKPQNYELMYKLAEQLAAGTPELRVDFYEVNGRLYFVELTFFDAGGFDKIEPKEWDYKLGSMIHLPIKNT